MVEVFFCDMSTVLSVRELNILLSLLEEDKWLELISVQFQRTFVKGDHFKICCSISQLLKQKLITSLTSRLVAYYILYDLYRGEPLASNPFLLVFLDSLQSNEIELVEKNFLHQLLSSAPPKEVCAPNVRFNFNL